MALKRHGIEELSHFAADLIRRSGEKALSYYGRGKTRVKFDEGLITEAELHLTEFFDEQLRVDFPEHQTFQSDDQGEGDYTHDDKRYLWIYDPLDGVANFQAGIPIWGISLALFDNFWPVFGLFYMPATGDLFSAQAGSNAFRGDEEIHISPQENINDESLLLTFSRFHRNYTSDFSGKMRNLGCTAAHICYVAMGRAEAAIIANESYQDLAAAWIIIEAAGGKFYRMDGSEFFLSDYLDGRKNDEHLLVSSPNTCLQVRDSLQKISV
ncbi:inositol monophosphatase family protein [Desulfococcaceae bacterium HSG8]|nr:inositol monophosphatase family protein [Desulfococcaceae bacterium HSG8]